MDGKGKVSAFKKIFFKPFSYWFMKNAFFVNL